MSDSMKISVVGLGKLGAPLVAMFASKGYDVVGIDVNVERVNDLAVGRIPFHEAGLELLWNASKMHITVTRSLSAVVDTDVTFIIVPTPSKDDGSFSLEYVLSVIKEMGESLRRKNKYHLVVVKSTVMPGATGGVVKEMLEKSSGKMCGQDIGLCYNPEFVALGSVLNDFLNPDFVLLGEYDQKAGNILEKLYENVHPNVSVERMNLVNAEVTKLALNTYVTMKITFANVLARVCERLPGADVDVVTAALGKDSRIGKKYLKGAVAYGGPCFPRDNKALTRVCKEWGVVAELPECIDRENAVQRAQLAEKVIKVVPKNTKVAVLGLAYKQNTDVLEESAGIDLVRVLAQENKVVVYDPVALSAARKVLGTSVEYAASLKECVDACDVIVVMLPYDEFRQIPVLIAQNKKKVVIDCWRILHSENIKFVDVGRGGGAV